MAAHRGRRDVHLSRGTSQLRGVAREAAEERVADS
jgi:hypothetical protein